MRLSCVRHECNADRCSSRRCDKYEICVNSFDVNSIFSALMISFSAIFWMNDAAALHPVASAGLAVKNITIQQHLHHHHISCTTDKLPDAQLTLECNVFAFECGFYLKFDEYFKLKKIWQP